MKINKWKLFQFIQFVLKKVVSIVLFLRKVDGSGAENTTEVKWISFAIWIGFYLFLLALEYGIRFLVTIKKRENKEYAK